MNFLEFGEQVLGFSYSKLQTAILRVANGEELTGEEIAGALRYRIRAHLRSRR